MRTSRPISVTLGEMQERVDARVRSGDYASASEVVRAGLRALDREESVLDNVLRAKVEQALADSRPALPADEVFAALRARHAERLKATGHGV
ncbi:MAG: type II toxin-antitoxin system ParD family antitoxin [Methylobacterium sp.]|uniref:type II toxin-antitoxin system ParD family antitoxin n=1 Tax=unclassified Methylobacterium TaxID=2615210 RepID=UPI0011CBE375|nr:MULTISPECIES: type II toxin-antitoxin system ParD family antitoxin [unclassified Methylobacterium]MDO9426347.1 type II toxin-antitoxin system ParD family antitoxin [Methylobacterium sp.]TXM77800.1 type II toxin-antitoxin system ParD family antitoxin [Methylobacterium sp. WL69]